MAESVVPSVSSSTSAPRKKIHPFMPAPMHKPHIIRWLKRFHAWFGVLGAVAGIIFGWTGFVLNHRTDFRIGADNVSTEMTLPAPESRAFVSGDEFGQYIKREMDLFGAPRAPAMGMGNAAVPGGPMVDNPERFQAQFRAASNSVTASYTRGDETIKIVRQDRPPIRTLNRMHLGQAPNMGWQIVIDAYAGILIFLSLSGMLIWSRLSGTRLLGGGLILTSLSLVVYWTLLGP